MILYLRQFNNFHE